MTKELDRLVHDVSYGNSNRVSLFLSIPVVQQARVFLQLSPHVKKQLLSELQKEDIILILEDLDPDEGTDLLQLLPKKLQQELVENLNENLQKNVGLLLKFDKRTAAGLMSLDYVQVDDLETIETVIKQIKKHENKTGRLPTILILSDGQLAGHLPGHKLFFADQKHTAGAYLHHIPAVNYTAGFDTVLDIFKSNPHQKVVVIGEHDNILGVIYSDDVLQLIQENHGASLYTFAGVSGEELVFDSVKRKVLFRYKWLIINLFTTFVAAMTVQLFEDTISRNVLFAVFMPIVAGMGGNAGTQVLAVMVRGISQTQLSLSMVLSSLRKEISAGFVNGLINGIIIFTIVIMTQHDVIVASALTFAMVVNLVVAAIFGTTVPVLMKKLGKDPASSATVFITTATDVFGFMAFLGLATLLLR